MDRRIYGYVRISTPKQNIDRQVRNIKKYILMLLLLKKYTPVVHWIVRNGKGLFLKYWRGH